MTLDEHAVPANDVRVPAVKEGEAIIVSRYGAKPKAVILHPDDYARLAADAALVDAASAIGGYSEGALAARELEDRPHDESLVEDRERLVRLLGL